MQLTMVVQLSVLLPLLLLFSGTVHVAEGRPLEAGACTNGLDWAVVDSEHAARSAPAHMAGQAVIAPHTLALLSLDNLPQVDAVCRASPPALWGACLGQTTAWRMEALAAVACAAGPAKAP